MPVDRTLIRQQMKIYGPAVILVIATFVLAFQFIKPAPPERVSIATGGVDGAYHQFAQRYAGFLEREGITLELRPSAGSVENVALLRAGEVDLALVQGGVGQDPAEPMLESLGSLYYEPLWLFHRADRPLQQLRELRGWRLAVGPQGSGTRALVSGLLRANGISERDADWVESGGQAAVDALLEGRVDAAFFVISAQSALVDQLLRDPRVAAADFVRAEAYTRRYRYLSDVVLPEGSVDLAQNLPSTAVRMLATTANLVTHPDTHPAIIGLMLQAARAVHRDGGWFEQPEAFPQPGLLGFPLNAEADRFYQHGPPFLQRFLPFWAASLVDRLKVMLVPLLVLMLPLIKVMPPIYTWRMRARVYRWYGELEVAEKGLAAGDVGLDRVHRELDRIESEVRRVRVPLSFTDQLYHLRQHIDLVRQQINGS